jgi:hypothetical protein
MRSKVCVDLNLRYTNLQYRSVGMKDVIQENTTKYLYVRKCNSLEACISGRKISQEELHNTSQSYSTQKTEIAIITCSNLTLVPCKFRTEITGCL